MPRRFAFQFSLICLLCAITASHSANVLCMFTSTVRSQLHVFMAVANTLIERGHNVTIVTTIPIPPQSEGKGSYRHVLLERRLDSIQKLDHNMLELSRNEFLKFEGVVRCIRILNLFAKIQSDSVKETTFQRFLQEDNHFDLMLLGYYHNDYLAGVGARYLCPVAVISLGAPYGPISRMVGNPEATSYVQFSLFGRSQPMSFMERMANFLWAVVEPFMYVYSRWLMEGYYKCGLIYLLSIQVISNISLVLSNDHFSLRPIRPLVPALVQIGGVQFKDEPDALPEDVQVFLDSSPNGAILYTVGSKARGTLLKPERLKIVLSVLATLDQRILWEWEHAEEPPKISNILFRRTLPHEDIFFHPNIRLFITDGRLITIHMAGYHGVPIVGLPINDHEPFTVQALANKGYGVAMDVDAMTEGSLKSAIVEVLNNPQYAQQVRNSSNLFRDRPMTPRKTAAFWLEYVMRYRGASHMQSPLVHMPFIQIWNLDLIGVIWLSGYVFVGLTRAVVILLRKAIRLKHKQA